MAKVLQNIFTSNDQISQSATVQSWHVSQSVDAFTGASDYDITISGSLTVIGPVTYTGSLSLTGSVIASEGFTGSLLGTSSWANNAQTALTASFVQNAQTASYVLNAVSSSFSSTASFVNPLNQDVILTGSLSTTGSVTLRGLTLQPNPFVVTIDNTTGQLAYTSSTATGLQINPGLPFNSFQFNNAGAFDGTNRLTFDGTTLRATGSFTGSFTGTLFGNATSATTATNATNATNATSATNSTNTVNVNTTADNTTNSARYITFIDNLGGGNRGIFFSQNITYNPLRNTLFTGKFAPTSNSQIGTGMYLPAANTLGFSTNGAQRLRITPNGGMGLGVASPTDTSGRFEASNDIVAFTSSDRKWKKNIQNIQFPLEKISQINGVEFDWIEDEPIHGNKGHDIGVIAQEIETILPDAVQTRESGMKAVKYDRIIPLLIEAIKEQQKQIDYLESKIK